MNKKKIAIIGSGFSGLSSAAYLAKEGYEVHVFEKNECLGGRARKFKIDGFSFDMGPSWYWMPEVMEAFFKDFQSCVSDHFELKKLSPAFNLIFEGNEKISIPNDYKELKNLFELCLSNTKLLPTSSSIDHINGNYNSRSNISENPKIFQFLYRQVLDMDYLVVSDSLINNDINVKKKNINNINVKKRPIINNPIHHLILLLIISPCK